MDRQQIQLSVKEPEVPHEESRRRRRKKAITSSSCTSMDQITVDFVLPTMARSGSSPDTLLLEVAGNWTVEQVGKNWGHLSLSINYSEWMKYVFLLSRWKLRCGWRRWLWTSALTSTSATLLTTASCSTRRKAPFVRSMTSTRSSRHSTAFVTGEVPPLLHLKVRNRDNV